MEKDSVKIVKLPKKVMVLGRPFKVSVQERIEVDGEEVSGSLCMIDKEICIEECQPLHEKMGILAHEMGHAGLVITGLDQKFSEKEIEVFCQLMRALVEDYLKAFK